MKDENKKEQEAFEISLEAIVEAILFAAGKPMMPDKIAHLFPKDEVPEINEIQMALENLVEDYSDKGIRLQKVASGYHFQVRQEVMPWVHALWEEKVPRYSQAFLETLTLVAYRQPITRGEIEEVRGVSVSSSIMRSLLEREWIRVVGHKEVPGQPALYATTKKFLDHFNLSSLGDLPVIDEVEAMIKEQRAVEDQAVEEKIVALLPQDQRVEKEEGDAVAHENHVAPLTPSIETVRQEKEKQDIADQEVFATVDELLRSVKTDFTDFETEEQEACSKSKEVS